MYATVSLYTFNYTRKKSATFEIVHFWPPDTEWRPDASMNWEVGFENGYLVLYEGSHLCQKGACCAGKWVSGESYKDMKLWWETTHRNWRTEVHRGRFSEKKKKVVVAVPKKKSPAPSPPKPVAPRSNMLIRVALWPRPSGRTVEYYCVNEGTAVAVPRGHIQKQVNKWAIEISDDGSKLTIWDLENGVKLFYETEEQNVADVHLSTAFVAFGEPGASTTAPTTKKAKSSPNALPPGFSVTGPDEAVKSSASSSKKAKSSVALPPGFSAR